MDKKEKAFKMPKEWKQISIQVRDKLNRTYGEDFIDPKSMNVSMTAARFAFQEGFKLGKEKEFLEHVYYQNRMDAKIRKIEVKLDSIKAQHKLLKWHEKQKIRKG